MIQAKCSVKFKPNALVKPVQRGGNKALKKAAAYVRGVARRKVKRRKHKSSAPGQPPFDHGHLKSSILFAVDNQNIAAYVGPQRTIGRVNAQGEIAPAVLEFGGMSRPGSNPAWIRKKGTEKITDRNKVISYFQKAGYGPVFMGNSVSSVASAANRGKKLNKDADPKWKSKIRKKYSTFLKKNIFYLDLPLKSSAMVHRAADNAIKFFGYPAVPSSKIAPRPFMGPSLEDSKSFIAQCFRNSIQP